jgi:hypothetical protein
MPPIAPFGPSPVLPAGDGVLVETLSVKVPINAAPAGPDTRLSSAAPGKRYFGSTAIAPKIDRA